MEKYIMVTTTFEDENEANKVIDALLDERLVSCCQLSTIKSKYHWQGKIEQANEYLLLAKSKKSLYKDIEKKILELHSYETPQIVMIDISDGYKEYLDWIGEETR